MCAHDTISTDHQPPPPGMCAQNVLDDFARVLRGMVDGGHVAAGGSSSSILFSSTSSSDADDGGGGGVLPATTTTTAMTATEAALQSAGKVATAAAPQGAGGSGSESSGRGGKKEERGLGTDAGRQHEAEKSGVVGTGRSDGGGGAAGELGGQAAAAAAAGGAMGERGPAVNTQQAVQPSKKTLQEAAGVLQTALAEYYGSLSGGGGGGGSVEVPRAFFVGAKQMVGLLLT